MSKFDVLVECNPNIMEELKKAQKEAAEDELLTLEEAKAFLRQHFINRNKSVVKKQS